MYVRICQRLRWAVVVALMLAAFHASAVAQSSYYVDCSASGVEHLGTSSESPWHSLAEVNAHAFRAGDHLLLRRGTRCDGHLSPQGSGTEASPITISAYGDGLRPHIVAPASSPFALSLTNQRSWEISQLDISGGTTYGVYISGDRGSLDHIHLRELTVHDVGTADSKIVAKGTGLIVIAATGNLTSFDDVLVEGVFASHTSQWSGIYVSGSESSPATHVVIRNSIAHDVQGDGIVIFRARDSIIENSVAWYTGMQHTESIGTPNAIWTWSCDTCTVQNNEAFLTDSPGIDGGAFDIDYWNIRNTVRSNYGHDTQGYCVSIFAAYKVTKDSEVSDNLCVHNGLSPRLAAKQGAIFLLTWQGGSIDGVLIRGNTVLWDPPGSFPPVQRGDTLDVRALILNNNEIYSTALPFISPAVTFSGSLNRYILVDQASRNTALPLEPGGNVTRLDIPSHSDVSCWPDGCRNQPAQQIKEWDTHWAASLRGSSGQPTHASGWQLYDLLPGERDARDRELVILKSQSLQYRDAGLRVTAVCACNAAQLLQLDQDWQLSADGIELLMAIKFPSGARVALVSPRGVAVREWDSSPPLTDLALALRQFVGPPVFAGLPAR